MSHRTTFTKVCDVIEKKKKKSPEAKEKYNFMTSVKRTYLLWKRQSTQNQVTKVAKQRN